MQYTARDSNPRPSECEPPPITTRPGLPPLIRYWDDYNDAITDEKVKQEQNFAGIQNHALFC